MAFETFPKPALAASYKTLEDSDYAYACALWQKCPASTWDLSYTAECIVQHRNEAGVYSREASFTVGPALFCNLYCHWACVHSSDHFYHTALQTFCMMGGYREALI